MNSIILADNQAVTSAGILFFVRQINKDVHVLKADHKKELLEYLGKERESLVILDYTLFDISTVDELHIIQMRFPQAYFLLFSDHLTNDFVKRIKENKAFSVLLKTSSITDIEKALNTIFSGGQFINMPEDVLCANEQLTLREREILRELASGKTTKEIASALFLSTHTIVTHRKNIFRKINVNNVHEATKYALRAGIIDPAEYYI